MYDSMFYLDWRHKFRVEMNLFLVVDTEGVNIE
jgi:hypothetical protein